MTAPAWIACALMVYAIACTFAVAYLLDRRADDRRECRRLRDLSSDYSALVADAMRQARANAEKRCEVGR